MVSSRPSATRLRQRFADREDLGREGVVTAHWGHLPQGPLQELLDLIESEFSIPAGLLRPDDPIGKLVAPFSIQNPMTWLWAEAALEDAASELNWRFAKRMLGAGVDPWAVPVSTIGHLVQLWCIPSSASGGKS
jgi:hypothetical protein